MIAAEKYSRLMAKLEEYEKMKERQELNSAKSTPVSINDKELVKDDITTESIIDDKSPKQGAASATMSESMSANHSQDKKDTADKHEIASGTEKTFDISGESRFDKPDNSIDIVDKHKHVLAHKSILNMLPKKFQLKGSKLLDFLTNANDLSWDDGGEINVGGTVIANSNIIKLLKATLRPYKSEHPVGLKVFWSKLKSLKTPLYLIGNDAYSGVLKSQIIKKSSSKIEGKRGHNNLEARKGGNVEDEIDKRENVIKTESLTSAQWLTI